MKYIVDSNCFLEPHKGYCPIDVGVSFWNKIRELANRGVIVSIDKVKDELYTHNDDLKNWLQGNIDRAFFKRFEGNEQNEKFIEISRWALNSSFYNQRAKTKFTDATKADIYLVAFAAVDPAQWKVVSFERSAPQNIGEIKLPDACRQFGVSCILPQEMFREIQETF